MCRRAYQKATRHRWKKQIAEYFVWNAMRQRCENENDRAFKNYGGRGITVCERWQKFEHFYADMGPRPSPKHSIERIDNDGPYSPGNCKWATRAEQQRNRRNNVYVHHRGKTQTLVDWATEAGIHKSTLYSRWLRKWDFETALNRPVATR